MKKDYGFILIIIFLVSSTSLSFAKDKLLLSAVSGNTPLTIQVIGPKGFVAKGVGKAQKWVGCGIDIDWGEGNIRTLVNDCADHLVHTYKSPGIYKVTAEIWHPGPDDGPVTDWSDSVNVHVQ